MEDVPGRMSLVEDRPGGSLMDAPRGPAPFVPSALEVDAFPDDTAAWAASVPPSAEAVGPAGVLDAQRLSSTGRLDAIIAAEHHIAWLQARQLRALAALAGPPPPGPDPDLQAEPSGKRFTAEQRRERLDKEWIREDVRAAVGESAIGAGNRIRLARELTGRLAPTLAALEAGRIGMRHVHYLTDALAGHTDDTATSVQAAVLPAASPPGEPTAPAPDMARFRRTVRREVLRADPRTADQARDAAVADRRVAISDNGDGTATQFALLPIDGAEALMAAIAFVSAGHAPDDPRTPDQRRADALVQLARDALNRYADCPHCHHSTSRATHRRRHRTGPVVQVTVALSTLVGLDEQPGELNGQPVSANHARRLAADPDATWRRLVTDDLGHLVDYGRTTYRPPADLARHVAARDRNCVFPTCDRQACTCDTDHTRAWDDGGDTNEGNLAILCCRHHHGKHEGRWAYRRLPNGDVLWRSPTTGRTYRKPAATYPIDHTSNPINKPVHTEHPPTETDADPPHDPPF